MAFIGMLLIDIILMIVFGSACVGLFLLIIGAIMRTAGKFPETITLTIHRDTGKYYVPKNERTRGGKYMFSLFISLLAGAFIVNMFL